jgi:hypothetical protein
LETVIAVRLLTLGESETVARRKWPSCAFIRDHLRGFDVGGVGGDDDGYDDGVLAVWASSDAVGGRNGVVERVRCCNDVGNGVPNVAGMLRLRACQSATRQRGEQ